MVCLYVLSIAAKGVSCFHSLTRAVQSLSVESKQAHTFFLCPSLFYLERYLSLVAIGDKDMWEFFTKIIVTTLALYMLSGCDFNPKITYNAQKDANTAIEVLKKHGYEEYENYIKKITKEYCVKFGISEGLEKAQIVVVEISNKINEEEYILNERDRRKMLDEIFESW